MANECINMVSGLVPGSADSRESKRRINASYCYNGYLRRRIYISHLLYLLLLLFDIALINTLDQISSVTAF
jgi:hypothetical protein